MHCTDFSSFYKISGVMEISYTSKNQTITSVIEWLHARCFKCKENVQRELKIVLLLYGFQTLPEKKLVFADQLP